jgi:cytochrome c553
MRDIAAYYASLPLPRNAVQPRQGDVPVLVRNGAPMRNIAPCASCHGGEMAIKTGAVFLEGNSAVYIKAQLVAFATAARHNDINAQMRNVARNMTLDEMDQVAKYYAGTQP